MHYAAKRFYDAEILSYLISLGVDINSKNTDGYTALASAIMRGNFDAVQQLIENGADPLLTTRDGKTILQLCLEEYVDSLEITKHGIVQVLLDSGIDPAQFDNKGVSALSIALYYKKYNPELASLLLANTSNENEIAASRAAVRNMKWNKFKSDFDELKEPTLASILIPLFYFGLSLLLREKIYKNKPQNNGFSVFNTLIIVSAFTAVGVLTFGGLMTIIARALGMGWESLSIIVSVGLLGSLAGFIGGLGIALRYYNVRTAFKTKAVLYYLPSVLLAVSGAIVICMIWLNR
jgi:hypothetical protein